MIFCKRVFEETGWDGRRGFHQRRLIIKKKTKLMSIKEEIYSTSRGKRK